VNRVFVQQLYKEISDAVESSRKNLDSWRDCICLEEAKALKCSRPLLQVGGEISICSKVLITLKLL